MSFGFYVVVYHLKKVIFNHISSVLIYTSPKITMFRTVLSRTTRAITTSSFPQTTPSIATTALRFFSSDDSNLDRVKGAVKWFDVKKGFGFIVPEDGSGDVFVHQTSIYAPGFRSLAEEEVVEYNLFTDDNGRNTAVDVTGPNGDYVKGAPRQSSYDDFMQPGDSRN